MNPSCRRTVVATLIVVAGSGALWGQARARLWGVVSDSEGQPIPGVTVTVIDPAENVVRQQQSTNKKGRYTIALLDATRPYLFRFEKDGYQTREDTFKIPLQSNTRRDYTLASGAGGATGFAPTDPTKVRGGGAAAGAYNDGVIAMQNDKLDVAKEKLLKAIELDPEFKLTYSALARLHYRLEEWEGARDRAIQALEHDPEDQAALSVLYQAYESLGDEESSAKTYHRLLSLTEPAAAAYNVGVEAYEADKHEEAKAQFLKALELDPELGAAKVALMQVYTQLSSWVEAAAAAERVLAEQPEHVGALAIRFDAYQQIGDTEKALAAREALVAVAPERLSGSYFDRALALFNDNKMEEARVFLEQTLELEPDHARAHYILGLVAVNTGASDTAKEHLTRFLELDPDHADAATATEMLKYLED